MILLNVDSVRFQRSGDQLYGVFTGTHHPWRSLLHGTLRISFRLVNFDIRCYGYVLISRLSAYCPLSRIYFQTSHTIVRSWIWCSFLLIGMQMLNYDFILHHPYQRCAILPDYSESRSGTLRTTSALNTIQENYLGRRQQEYDVKQRSVLNEALCKLFQSQQARNEKSSVWLPSSCTLWEIMYPK